MASLTDPTDLDGLRQALGELDPNQRLKPLGLKYARSIYPYLGSTFQLIAEKAS